MIDRDLLFTLIVIYRQTIKQTAKILGVSPRTVSKYKKVYAIDGRLWWKHWQIICSECHAIIDPDCQLDEQTRKKLLRNGNVLCDECKIASKRERDRLQKKAYRQSHREEYNKYMRELMRRRTREKRDAESTGGNSKTESSTE